MRNRLIDGTLVLLVMAMYVGGYAFITLIPDTARDLGAAWRIVHAHDLPLLGPEIGQRWHLGPIWFYILAPVVALAGTMTQVAFVVGGLASLKFPLAYWLGVRVHSRELGLIWMGVLALPGWNTLEHVVFAHTNMVEAATLATLLLASKVWEKGAIASFACLGFIASLALHAHPTTLVLVPPVLIAAWYGSQKLRFQSRLLRWGAMCAGFVLPLLPVLVHEARGGFPQWHATLEFGAGTPLLQRLDFASSRIWGYFAHVFAFIREFLFASLPLTGWVVACWTAVVMVGGAVLMLPCAEQTLRRKYVLGLIYVASAVVAVPLLREATSFYMLFTLIPLTAGMAALGWASMVLRLSPQYRAVVTLGLVSTCLIASAAQLHARYANWSDGWQWIPFTVSDVAVAPTHTEALSDYLPVFELDQLAQAICTQGHALLGGDAGALMEMAQGLPVALRCGLLPQFETGGVATWVGFPAALLRQAGSLRMADAKGLVWALSTSQGTPSMGVHSLHVHNMYPPHMFRSSIDHEFSGIFSVGKSDWIAVTNLNRIFIAAQEPTVLADGLRLLPAAKSAGTWLYRAPHGSRVSVSVPTADPTWIHVALFADADLRDEPADLLRRP